MSFWRRKAFELFPRHRRELTDPTTTIYQLLIDLLAEVREAHANSDEAEAARIYGFAEWCFDHADLNNAVAVTFYEHLFDGALRDRQNVAIHISARIAAAVMPLWAARLRPERIHELRRLLGSAVGKMAEKIDLDAWPHRWFGFWSEYGPGYAKCPSIYAFIRPEVTSKYDKTALRRYLTTAQSCAATSRFPDPVTGTHHGGGVEWMTDGRWTWLSDLPDYIEMYDVAIPTVWYREIEAKNFIPPPHVNVDDPAVRARLDNPSVD